MLSATWLGTGSPIEQLGPQGCLLAHEEQEASSMHLPYITDTSPVDDTTPDTPCLPLLLVSAFP